jgi:FKBP-type peptidyl-prolyl cis-trans isomerase 2
LIKKTSIVLLVVGIFLLSLALVINLAKKKVEEGDTISVNYTITLDNGTVYYTTTGREPLKETLGEETFITGFIEAVKGMRVGESKTVTIPPEKAYGQHRSDLIGDVSRDRLPENLQPAIGQQLQTRLTDGTQAITVITDITDSMVTVDANHPLAGQNLTFDIELVTVEKNQALGGRAALRWAFYGTIVAAFTITVFYLRGRWRLQLVRVAPGK